MESLRDKKKKIEAVLDTQGRMRALKRANEARIAGEDDLGVPSSVDALNRRLAKIERDVKERLREEWASEGR